LDGIQYMKITRAFVPNMFTTLNMFSGFMSIISSTQGNYIVAAWFIILAGVFDALDGVMARITKSSSEFGVEFDSLSDIVSFGVAPSFLVYAIALHEFNNIGILVSAFPLIFGGIRLARFNVQLTGFDKDYFRGLPIPSAAGLIVTYVFNFYDETSGLAGFWGSMLIPMIIISSLLMVSLIRYDALPRPSMESFKKNPVKFLLLFLTIVAAVITKGYALFYIFIIYVCSGPVRALVEKIQQAAGMGEINRESSEEITSIDA
jgi:CDP-diacylglycerol---serine O-phosphatidyltransferase